MTKLPPPPLVLDLDDFCEKNAALPLLDELHTKIGRNFRVTLFTIPGHSPVPWLHRMKAERPWIEMVPHGLLHTTSRECQHWDRNQMEVYLDTIKRYPLVKGFKAPGWQLSDAVYEVLFERGYWIADHIENRKRRPAGMMAYELDAGRKMHGHVGHWGGHNANELSLIKGHVLEAWLQYKHDVGDADARFGWASEELQDTGTRGKVLDGTL